MTTSAEDRTTEAWTRYADRIRGLEGQEYDDAEREAWDDLQAELGEIAEPAVLGAPSSGA
ncbi:hypothetical protein [Conexibacter sp. SYSU D00693]|uniref:hypothetical protein n=1 Tax=Conexibacter sp. SYSU D00693 TaxID=2812560 RepID=UPI00196A8FF5|nr:hypothetical protein [Conexibacter sp. SYSU D00693]